jgi:hypothetical protein
MLPYFVKMDMTRYKLGKGIDYGNNRFAYLVFFHAIGTPKAPGSGHSSTLCSNVAS